MIKYPFIKCLHPVLITNKATGQKQYVGCGKCVACKNLRSSALTLKCKLESLAHKYCHFITLTYDETFVPVSVPICVSGSHGQVYNFVSICHRTKEFGNILCQYAFRERLIDELYDKLDTEHGIPYLSKRDAQLFIKRLRKNLNSKNYANIRFFLCGEYGPEHLRPHYHLLVWHSDEQTSKGMADAVRESWKFGRSDIQLVTDDCTTYVASYLNNFSSLPLLYQQGQYKPFSCHSIFLGEKFYRSQGKEIYKLSAPEFIRRSERFNDSVSEFTLWRSLKNAFYPKCRGFTSSSPSERQFLYSLYARFRSRSETSRQPYRLAKDIVREIEELVYLRDIPYDDLSHVAAYYDRQFRLSSTYDDFIKARKLFQNGLMPDMDYINECDKYIKEKQRITSIIYKDLALSKQFIELNCNSYDRVDIDVSIQHLENFYRALELHQLGDFYSSQDQVITDGLIEYDELEFFYDSMSLRNLLDSNIYKIYKSNIIKESREFMKHKQQNDANRLLFSYVGLL